MNNKGYTIIEIIFASILLLGAGGWVANIVKLAGMTDILTGMGVLRVIGIFAPPLGAVLGFL